MCLLYLFLLWYILLLEHGIWLGLLDWVYDARRIDSLVARHDL